MSNVATVLALKLEIPDEILSTYEKLAEETQKPLEQVLVERLTESVGHTSKKPLYVNDEQRAELEKILGRNLYRPKDLIEAVGRLALVRLENAKVTFDPVLLERLKSRHFSDLPFDAWIAQQINIWAEQYVGMR